MKTMTPRAKAATKSAPSMSAALFVRFECGQEDRMSPEYGPYPFVQLTYLSVRVGENGDEFLATFADGWWITQDGQKWSDVVIGPDQSA